jgi:cytochrome c biogenesis protein CcmG, thiol:disulfide interchange protein DsbE
MKRTTALIIVTLLLTTITVAQVKKMFTDKKVPNIEVSTLDGKKVKILDAIGTGKITVINFWATWCGPCKLELNNIAELYPDWKKDYNVQIIAISIDDSRNTAKVKTYVDGRSWNYTILLDANQDLKRALNFQAPPYTLLLDKTGTIVHSHTGYSEGDEYILEDQIKALAKE